MMDEDKKSRDKDLELWKWDIEAAFNFIKELFSGEIAVKFRDEDIDGRCLLTLAEKHEEAEVFKKLGLTYGKVVRLKEAIREKVPLLCSNTPSSCSSSNLSSRSSPKPIMSSLTTQQRMLYKLKRSKINHAATNKWPGNSFPNFRLPEYKNELEKLAASLLEECSMPEIGFGLEGIKEHIKATFWERKRSQKRDGTNYDEPDKRKAKSLCFEDKKVDDIDSDDNNSKDNSYYKHSRKRPKPQTLKEEEEEEMEISRSEKDQDESGDTNIYSSEESSQDNSVKSSSPCSPERSVMLDYKTSKESLKKSLKSTKSNRPKGMEKVTTSMISLKSAEVVLLKYFKVNKVDDLSRDNIISELKHLGYKISSAAKLKTKQLMIELAAEMINGEAVSIDSDANLQNLRASNIQLQKLK